MEGIGCGRRAEEVRCKCGARMQSGGMRPKTLLTILGPVTYSRSCFRCPDCGATRFPGDEALDVVRTTRSPGVRRMMARAGSSSPFKEGAQDLKIYADIEVSPKDVERVAEGIGEEVESLVPAGGVQPAERKPPRPFAEGNPRSLCQLRRDRRPDDSERSGGTQGKTGGRLRENSRSDNWAACLPKPRRTKTDIRFGTLDSTSFVGRIEPADEFGWRIYAEALRRGLESGRQGGGPWRRRRMDSGHRRNPLLRRHLNR